MCNCASELLCNCNICLRQPPSLKGFASQAVFHLRYNIDQFELTVDTTYDHYKYVANSKNVSIHKLVPDTFSTLYSNCVKKLKYSRQNIL
jgi:hypothetical protein